MAGDAASWHEGGWSLAKAVGLVQTSHPQGCPHLEGTSYVEPSQGLGGQDLAGLPAFTCPNAFYGAAMNR